MFCKYNGAEPWSALKVRMIIPNGMSCRLLLEEMEVQWLVRNPPKTNEPCLCRRLYYFEITSKICLFIFFLGGGAAWSCYTETRWHYLIILVLGHCGKNRNNFLEGRTLVWFLLPAFQHQVVAVILIEINNMYTSNVTSYDGLFFVLSYRTKSS